MSNLKNDEAYQKALAHVIQHATFDEDTIGFVSYVTNQKGNVPFCTRMLGGMLKRTQSYLGFGIVI